MGILYILLGLALGAIITYSRLNKTASTDNEELLKLKQKNDSLDLKIKSGEERHQRFEEELMSTKEAFDQRKSELLRLDAELKTIKDQLNTLANTSHISAPISQAETPIVIRNGAVEKLEKKVKTLSIQKSELETQTVSLEKQNLQFVKTIENLEKDLKERTLECNGLNRSLSSEKEAHQASKKELADQRTSIQSLGQKFNLDFQNMGIKILEELESQQKTKL